MKIIRISNRCYNLLKPKELPPGVFLEAALITIGKLIKTEPKVLEMVTRITQEVLHNYKNESKDNDLKSSFPPGVNEILGLFLRG